MSTRILTGDCRDVLKTLADASVDSIVTDPPYELGFMGKKWDSMGVANDAAVWRECLRVLKPGGHLLAFGGTRTQHRMVCAIEDAGFEIRDQVGWVYGSGFPKSRNLDGEWQGWGTALKPAWEPIVVARKPLIGTVAANVLAHGTGALNIDGCRVEAPDGVPLFTSRGESRSVALGDGLNGSNRTGEVGNGRWPANLIHDGSDEVLAAFPDAPGQMADASSSSSRKTQNVYGAMRRGNGRDGEASADSTNDGDVGFKMKPGARRFDEGSAARFFYCAKASKKDRGEGNSHPTVKPTELMRYLCRLVTPPGGLVLDPFMGSGSTLKAAELEGFSAIGIEMDPIYVALAQRRIASDAPLFAEITNA